MSEDAPFTEAAEERQEEAGLGVMWGSMGFGHPGVTWGKLAVQLEQRENLEAWGDRPD